VHIRISGAGPVAFVGHGPKTRRRCKAGHWSFTDRVAVFWVIMFSVGVVLLSFGRDNHALTVIGAMMVILAFGIIVGYSVFQKHANEGNRNSLSWIKIRYLARHFIGFYLGKNEKKSDKTGDRKPRASRIGDSRLQSHLIASSKSCCVPVNMSVKATIPNTNPRLVIQFPPTDPEIARSVRRRSMTNLGTMKPAPARYLGKNKTTITAPQRSAQTPPRHLVDSAKSANVSSSATKTPNPMATPSPRNSGSLNKSILYCVLYGVNYTLKNLPCLTATME
jgi:hypothetical protein